MLNHLKNFFLQQELSPHLFSFFIPSYFLSRSLYISIRSYSNFLSGNLLDVGCGNKPFSHLFNTTQYIGLEISDNVDSSADCFYDGVKMPFSDNSFDSVFSSEVLEHVYDVDHYLSEIHRVLKNDSYFLLTTPYLWEIHGAPMDYRRFTNYGLVSLFESYGFKIVSHTLCCSGIDVVFQTLSNYIYRVSDSNLFLRFFGLFLVFFCNLVGFILTPFFPKNNLMYLGNVFLLKKIA